MFRKFSKKRLAILVSVTTLALAAIAFAFFSSSGTGSGSAGVENATAGLTLHGSITGSLTPGGSKDVTFTADNTNASPVKVGTVSGTISVDQASIDAGCAASNFSFTGATENQTIPGGTNGTTLDNKGSVSMPTSASNQDACKGAQLTLNLSSN